MDKVEFKLLMRTFFLMIFCMFYSVTVHATQTCKPDSIPASMPDSQLLDNGDGTITDSRTGLMWKKCLEGVSGASCETGSPNAFTWQAALEEPRTVNEGGFAGYTDWRLPNIRELIALVEEQCNNPAINLNRFPNTPSSEVWSGSPDFPESLSRSRIIEFYSGDTNSYYRNSSIAVRLVRGGQ